MSLRQTVTFMGTTQTCFRGGSRVAWCRKPRLRLANRHFALAPNHPMGHKTIRLVAPSRNASDNGWLTVMELPASPAERADGVEDAERQSRGWSGPMAPSTLATDWPLSLAGWRCCWPPFMGYGKRSTAYGKN